MNNTEHQRAFRERMYERGYQQKNIWIKREGKTSGKKHFDRMDFIWQADALTANLSTAKKTAVYKKALAYIAELTSPKSGKR